MNALRRIQSQSIQMKFFNPVRGVRQYKFPDRLRVFPVEVQGLSPLVFISIREDEPAEAGCVIPIRPEMVVNDVENHTHSLGMRIIDESPEVIRTPVQPRWR